LDYEKEINELKNVLRESINYISNKLWVRGIFSEKDFNKMKEYKMKLDGLKLDGLLNDHTLTEYKKAKIVPTRLQYEDHYKSSSSIKSIKKKASECLLKRPYGQTRNVERKLIEKCQCSEHKDSGGDNVGRPYATIQSAGQSKDASANNSKLPEPDINWDKFKDRPIALPPREMKAIIRELKQIGESEINFSIGYFFDSIWIMKLGDDMNGYKWENSFSSIEDGMNALIGAILKIYPTSDYAIKKLKRTN